jgi:small multidrug resistance pump
MNPWLLLTGAIASEVAATTALKASDGFTRPAPAVIVVVGYGISFWLLALVLKDLPVGVVYAIWSAVGTVGVALLGLVLFGESMHPAKALGIALIVGGVALLFTSGAEA